MILEPRTAIDLIGNLARYYPDGDIQSEANNTLKAIARRCLIISDASTSKILKGEAYDALLYSSQLSIGQGHKLYQEIEESDMRASLKLAILHALETTDMDDGARAPWKDKLI